MIDKEERMMIARMIAAHITNETNEGMIGGQAGVITAPQLWYLDNDGNARAATVVGFYGCSVILCTTGNGQVFRVHESGAWSVYEEALCASADLQKKKVEEAQANYLATCNAASKFLKEARDKKRAEAERNRKRPAE